MDNNALVLDSLKARYEWARLRWAFGASFVVLPLVCGSILLYGPSLEPCLAGAWLLWLSVYGFWKGQSMALAVRKGFLAGIIVYVLPVILCEAGQITSAIGCFVGGLGGGFLLVRGAKDLAADQVQTYFLTGAAIMITVGYLGCGLIGFSFAMVILAGMALAIGPRLLAH